MCGVHDIEQEIREVDATMSMEGMPLTEGDKENLRTVLRGDVSVEEMRQRIIAKHSHRAESKRINHGQIQL